MPKRALIEHRPWLLASLAAAIAYYFLWNNPIGGLWLLMLKGAGVGLLAIYAWHRAKGADGLIIGTVLALAAAGDVAMDLRSDETGLLIPGAIFAASNCVAVVLYLRNRREAPSQSQMLLGAVLLVAAPALSYYLSRDVSVTLYAVTLGAMAATAWTSRFPRYRVGMGAVLFVLSDWLIFSQTGPVDLGDLPDILIWPLYYGGQFMIATGVVQTLRGEMPAK